MILNMFISIWLLLDNFECIFNKRCLKSIIIQPFYDNLVQIYYTRNKKISRWNFKSTHWRIGFWYSLTFIFSLFVDLLLPIARWMSQNLLKVSKLRQNMQTIFSSSRVWSPVFCVWVRCLKDWFCSLFFLS